MERDETDAAGAPVPDPPPRPIQRHGTARVSARNLPMIDAFARRAVDDAERRHEAEERRRQSGAERKPSKQNRRGDWLG